MGLADVLGIVFLVLKLEGIIAWPWLWVLSPWWISLLLTLLIILCD